MIHVHNLEMYMKLAKKTQHEQILKEHATANDYVKRTSELIMINVQPYSQVTLIAV